MKALPLHIEVQIHKAQTAAIDALHSGASFDSVRLDLGRQLFLISRVCGKRLWHRTVGRLGLKEQEARSLVKAAKKADRKSKLGACRSGAAVVSASARRGATTA